MDEANEETIQRLFAPLSGSQPSTSAELLERIDVDDLMLELDTDRLLRSPVPCVVDTEFFYSAFQSQLKHGGAPRSLQPAMEGEVRLFMAEETFEELVEKKLPKFATQLGTTTAVLENFLGPCWLDWLNLVELPTESVDPRVAAVVARDSSDRPAACLASLLAPCVLLTNDRDFEALVGAIQSLRHVVVIRAAAALGEATLQLQTMATLPTLPVTGAAKGTRWVANRIRVSPWILGGIIVLLVVWAYRRQDGEIRAVIRKTAAEVGNQYLKNLGDAQAKVTLARTTLNKRLVLPSGPRTPEQIVLRELALIDGAASAQKLWERLDAESRPGVNAVRALLRSHPSAQNYNGGVWTFGYRLDPPENESTNARATIAR